MRIKVVVHGIILHTTIKCKILLLKWITDCQRISVNWYLYSLNLLICVSRISDLMALGQPRTTAENLMEHTLKMYFTCMMMIFFAFEWSTWYLLLFSRSLRMELRTLFTGVYSVDCPLGHSVCWRGIEQLPTSLVCCLLGWLGLHCVRSQRRHQVATYWPFLCSFSFSCCIRIILIVKQ